LWAGNNRKKRIVLDVENFVTQKGVLFSREKVRFSEIYSEQLTSCRLASYSSDIASSGGFR
jgi:hypothetical protein